MHIQRSEMRFHVFLLPNSRKTHEKWMTKKKSERNFFRLFSLPFFSSNLVWFRSLFYALNFPSVSLSLSLLQSNMMLVIVWNESGNKLGNFLSSAPSSSSTPKPYTCILLHNIFLNSRNFSLSAPLLLLKQNFERKLKTTTSTFYHYIVLLC